MFLNNAGKPGRIVMRNYRKSFCIVCVCAFLASAGAETPIIAKPSDAKPTVVKKGKNLVEVIVIGQGESKDEALSDAKRKAVEYGAGTYIYSQSKTRDFVLVRDTILTRSAGFVQASEVLSEKKTEDGIWMLKVRVTVSIKGIRDMWGVVTNLLKERGRPKVIVFINEKIAGKSVADSTVQTRIENVLLKSGFLLVDRKQLKAIERKDIEAAIAEDKPAKIQAIAKRFGAQLFITGSANAASGGQKTIGGVRVYTYEAEANVKCFRSDTAQLLSSIPGSATRGVKRVWRSAAKQALDLQAKKVAPKVRANILRFWQDVLEGRGEVILEVEGISFKQYVALKKALKGIKGVKDVTVKYSNKVARCSIQADTTAEKLAERIVENIENIEVSDISQNVIKAKYVEKK